MKCALITGSTSVLGGAIAKRISSDLKLHIILHYNNSKAKAEALKAEILAVGGSAELMQFDVTDHVTVVKELAKWKEENSGNTIDVLVNNAGILKDNLLVFTPEEDWRSVIDTKVLGFYNVTSALIRDMMLRRHGRIITVASLRGLSGGRGQVNYSAANGALISATSALSKEAGPRNVTVNAIAPGFIESEMTEQLDTKELVKHIPLGRFGKPEEVAELVSFLASEKASYITGITIPISGGLL